MVHPWPLRAPTSKPPPFTTCRTFPAVYCFLGPFFFFSLLSFRVRASLEPDQCFFHHEKSHKDESNRAKLSWECPDDTQLKNNSKTIRGPLVPAQHRKTDNDCDVRREGDAWHSTLRQPRAISDNRQLEECILVQFHRVRGTAPAGWLAWLAGGTETTAREQKTK